MSAKEKSDLPEVAEKASEQGGLGRCGTRGAKGGAKENAELQSTVRTQSRSERTKLVPPN
jgi:hypothetical protein